MSRWATCYFMALAMAVAPAWADETPKADEEKQAEQAAAEKKKEDVILRLAELRIDEHVVPARMINLPIPGRTRTLQDLLDQVEEWSKDENIGAVLLDIGFPQLSMPDVEELRNGIAKLRKSGKKVSAFLNGAGPMGYLLACAADEIVMPPTGDVVIPGLGGLVAFMKGHYQMLGMEFEVITAGRYKYPGYLNERKPNKFFQEEIGAILDSWFEDYKQIIAQSRNLSPEAVEEAIDTAIFMAPQAQQRNLVDTLAYYDDHRDRLLSRHKMKRYKGRDSSLAQVNSIQDFMELINREMQKAEEARKAVGPKIAVLHARGPIINASMGAGFASQLICRDDFIKVVDDIRKNKSIKAVVLRIDSPGGSGYASDMIWKALRRLDESKPLVVSMGRVAGSGGYYIACPARRIFAQPTTITGSIGVIGMVQCAWSMFNRADYELFELSRGARSLLGAPHRELSKADRNFIQKMIDDFYDVFIERVAQTRRMPAEEVRKIAEGRIYTGRQALEIGLVDELGGLEEAVEAARSMANIPPSAELKLLHYPRPSSLGELFESFSSVGVRQSVEAFMKASAPAEQISFEQQLLMFSGRPQALCWMAMPAFYGPEVFSSASLQMVPRPAAQRTVVEQLLNP